MERQSCANSDFKVPALKNQPKYPNMITPRHSRPPYHRQPFPMFGPRGATILPKLNPTKNSSAQIGSFWCDSCDKGFNTGDILNQHLNEHQKCGLEGCQFEAHPNIITKHIQMQHASGIFKKISKLTTPEEISNWIAERKRKYPTRQNIDLKTAAEKEKIMRGEKLSVDNQRTKIGTFENSRQSFNRTINDGKSHANFKKGFFKNGHRNRPNHKTHRKKRKRGNTNAFPDQAFCADNILKKNEVDQFGSLPRFKGTYEICKLDLELEGGTEPKTDEHDMINDDDWDICNSNDKVEQSPILCGALANLKNCYGSSDEDSSMDFNKVKENSVTKSTILPNASLKTNAKQSTLNESLISIERVQSINNVLAFDKKKIRSTETLPIKIIDKRSILDKNLVSNKSIDKISHVETFRDEGIPNGNLMSHMNDDDDNDDNCPMEIKIERNDPKNFQMHKSDHNEDNNSETTNKLTANKIIHTKTPIKINNVSRSSLRKKLPSTLLEKLLQKEIIHERNVILQCVRFIRKNNYFDP